MCIRDRRYDLHFRSGPESACEFPPSPLTVVLVCFINYEGVEVEVPGDLVLAGQHADAHFGAEGPGADEQGIGLIGHPRGRHPIGGAACLDRAVDTSGGACGKPDQTGAHRPAPAFGAAWLDAACGSSPSQAWPAICSRAKCRGVASGDVVSARAAWRAIRWRWLRRLLNSRRIRARILSLLSGRSAWASPCANIEALTSGRPIVASTTCLEVGGTMTRPSTTPALVSGPLWRGERSVPGVWAGKIGPFGTPFRTSRHSISDISPVRARSLSTATPAATVAQTARAAVSTRRMNSVDIGLTLPALHRPGETDSVTRIRVEDYFGSLALDNVHASRLLAPTVGGDIPLDRPHV